MKDSLTTVYIGVASETPMQNGVNGNQPNAVYSMAIVYSGSEEGKGIKIKERILPKCGLYRGYRIALENFILQAQEEESYKVYVNMKPIVAEWNHRIIQKGDLRNHDVWESILKEMKEKRITIDVGYERYLTNERQYEAKKLLCQYMKTREGALK